MQSSDKNAQYSDATHKAGVVGSWPISNFKPEPKGRGVGRERDTTRKPGDVERERERERVCVPP